MALTRKFLSAMGIEADKIDQIIEAHTETLEGLKSGRDKYKEAAEKLPDVQKELDTLKEEQKKDAPYKEKYDTEHAEFEKFKSEQVAKETKAKKSEAYKKLLKEAGISDKHLEQLLKASVTDIDGLEFDEKGEVKDAKKQVETIKKNWSDFVSVPNTQGAKTPTPPQSNGGNVHGTGRARQLAEKYYADRYGVPAKNEGSKEE